MTSLRPLRIVRSWRSQGCAKRLFVKAEVAQRLFGIHPEVIDSEVLGLAVQLLKKEDILIQQIADILHFPDQAAFSKFFKKYVRVSPSDYRKTVV